MTVYAVEPDICLIPDGALRCCNSLFGKMLVCRVSYRSTNRLWELIVCRTRTLLWVCIEDLLITCQNITPVCNEYYITALCVYSEPLSSDIRLQMKVK